MMPFVVELIKLYGPNDTLRWDAIIGIAPWEIAGVCSSPHRLFLDIAMTTRRRNQVEHDRKSEK